MSEQKPSDAAPSAEPTPQVTVNEKHLVIAFIQYLRQKVSANECSPGQIEGIEIAVQCLESAFDLSDKNYAFQPAKPLLQLFTEHEGVSDDTKDEFSQATPAEIEQAVALKEAGNDLVKAGDFQGAIEKYNQAIKLHRDPVYFCNRAAAYCRLEQYDLAIQDCRTALALDEKYAKAYGRMGLAFSCINQYDHAIEAYKKAIELDPNNESYKGNLKIAEDKKRELENAGAGAPGGIPPGLGGLFGGLGGGPGAGGLPDLNQVFANPQLMQAAMSMMSDPNMQNMMSSMMGAFSGQESGGGIANLIAAGQNMAQQLQEQNPELIDQLRRQFNPDGSEGPPEGGAPGGPGAPGGQQQ